ncbi:MAG: hypothetical protein QXX41_12830 [Nitrososphaerota archaeon]
MALLIRTVDLPIVNIKRRDDYLGQYVQHTPFPAGKVPAPPQAGKPSPTPNAQRTRKQKTGKLVKLVEEECSHHC